MLTLTRRASDLTLVAAAFAAVGLVRLATIAPDPWEWDEVLFTRAVRGGIDVRVNSPHPPGYPVFVRAGQAIAALGVEPFRAATLATVAGGMLATIALYLLLIALGTSRPFALVGALFYALTPSIWLHGVRALSDPPGAAACLLALVFLVRAISGDGGPDLALAAVFVALAAGVRPQVGLALLPACLVAAVAVARRQRSLGWLALAAVTGLALSAAIWLPVFGSSGGFASWKEQFKGQMEYVTTFDSAKPGDLLRGSWWRRWWVDPIGDAWVSGGFLALAAAGALAVRREAARLALLFLPITALTMAVLSRETAPRYVAAFWAFPCALAALALERASSMPRLGKWVPVVASVILASFALLGVTPIVEVASKASPSVAVMKAVVWSGVSRQSVFACPMLQVHRDEYLGIPSAIVEAPGLDYVPRGSLLLCADDTGFRAAPRLAFAFVSPRLRRISRGRYLWAGIFEGRGPSGTRLFRPDDEIPASVDEPAEGARVRTPLFVRGWCQEVGGGRVDPVEFRVDSVRAISTAVKRVPRPDVAAVLPAIGDGTTAGYEATLQTEPLPPGNHVLTVVFQVGDRRRVYPPRRFEISP